MANVLRHLVAVLATTVWIRFALSPVLTYTYAFLSGGACFIGVAITGTTDSLDDAYFAWGHQALGLFYAACGALLLGLPAAALFALVRRGYVHNWMPSVFAVVPAAAGAVPFVLCRFPSVMSPPESVLNAWLLVLFAAALSFLVYWLAFVVVGRFQPSVCRAHRLGRT